MLRLVDGYVDLERCLVVREGRGEVRLTPMERSLLAYLADQAGVVPIEVLMSEVWGYAPRVRSRAPYVAIQRLRAKLEVDPSEPQHLLSVRGVGYRLEVGRPQEPPAPTRERSSGFFGRADELGALASEWASGRRLVTLVGPGGMGKTRLVQEHLAQGALGLQDPRTAFVPLSAVSDAAGVLDAICQALAVPLGSHSADPRRLRRLGRVLGSHVPFLLVLDNAEHLCELLAPQIQGLLDQAAGLRVLVTSRRPLGLAEERRVALGALDADAATSLMIDRAQRMRWDYAPDPREAEQVHRLAAEALEGLPLAIELAAARLPFLGAEGLQARLQPALGGATRGRTQWGSLQAALQWSWDLLEPGQAATLAQCTVFRGGFEAEAAEAVVQAEGWIPEHLQALVDHSLLQVRPGPTPRLTLLEVVRAFAEERLADADRAAAQERHRRWCSEVLAPLGAQLQGPSAAAATQRLLPERPNLEAGLSSAVAAEDVEGTASMALALDRLGHRVWRGTWEGRVDRLTEALGTVPPEHGTWVELRWRLIDALRMEVRVDEARRVLAETLAVRDDPRARLMLRIAQLSIEIQASNHEEGRRIAAEAQELADRVRDPRLGGIVLHQRSYLAGRLGNAREGIELARASQVLFEELGDVDLLVISIAGEAAAALVVGELERALDCHARGIRLAREHGLVGSVFGLTIIHGRVRRELGELERARELFVETRHLARDQGRVDLEVIALSAMLDVLLDLGERAEAERVLESLFAMDRTDVPASVWGQVPLLYGVSALCAGAPDVAEERLRAARDEVWNEPGTRLRVLLHLAAALALQGQLEAAEESLGEAIAVFGALPEAPPWNAAMEQAVLVRAHVLSRKGETEAAGALRLDVQGKNADVRRMRGWLG